jgi:hypothetical protein
MRPLSEVEAGRGCLCKAYIKKILSFIDRSQNLLQENSTKTKYIQREYTSMSLLKSSVHV